MAMLSVVTARIKPGRMDEFVNDVKELKKTEERVATNLRGMRLFVAQVSGRNTGLVSLMFEYADLASWGSTLDAELSEDPAFQAVAGADDAFEVLDQSLYVEIPI
jgi:hypothetical protein